VRNPFATAVSFIFMAFGFAAIVWVTSSLSGRAHSQQPPPAPVPAPVPGATQPAQPAPPPQQMPIPQARPQVPQATQPQSPSPDMAMPENGNDQGDQQDDQEEMNAPGSVDPNATANGGAPASTEAAPLLPGINPEGYTYDPTGRRDPFMPFGATSVLAQPMPMAPSVPNSLVPPSENSLTLFDLAQLKVVAIVWDVKDPKAMILDPKGKLHMLHKDSLIGRNNGFVYTIREGEVVVIEPVQNDSGVQSAMTRVMYLNGK
jgi:type IV pilus assembly protein PilP